MANNSVVQQKLFQFLRTSNVYESKDAAKQALSSLSSYFFGGKDCDGTPILARYMDNGVVKTLIGVCYSDNGSFTVTIFDDGTDYYEDLTKDIQEMLDSIGLEVIDDVITYVADPNCQLLEDAGSIKEAIDILGNTLEDLNYTIQEVAPTSAEPTTYTKYELVDQDGTLHGTISIPKDKFLEKAELVSSYTIDGQVIEEPALELTFILEDGSRDIVDLPVKDLIDTTDIASDTELKALEDAVGGELISSGETKAYNLGLDGEIIGGEDTVVGALEALDEVISTQSGVTPLVVDHVENTIALNVNETEDAGLQINDDKLDVSFDFGTFEYVIVYASTSADIEAIANPQDTNVVLASTQSLGAASNLTFQTIVLEDVDVADDAKLNALENVTIKDITLDGAKGASNAKLLFNTPSINVENVEVAQGNTMYNLIEGSGNGQNLNEFNANNIKANAPTLKHNVFNIYKLADDAVINVRNSQFNFNMENSNVMRLANYSNATGVTVNFENVDWTYENVEYGEEDKMWAGLVIYQPSSADVALEGDLSKIQTWTFNFKNCRYNGTKVVSNNFGEANQVIYLYNIGRNGISIDPVNNGVAVNFI